MMRTVHLYGKLADEFGPSFNLDVATPAEAVRALSANFGHRFLSMIRAGEWHVVAGDSLDEGDDFGTSEEMLFFGLGKSDLHIAPAMRGSGKGGFFQVVLGIALVATAFFMAPPTIGALGPTMGMGSTAFTAFGTSFTYGNLAMMGGMMALSGVSGMLSPTPQLSSSYGDRESPEERPSFLFNGPKNTTEQGGPVPVVYGKHLVGWTLVSSGIEVEQI